MKHRNCLALCTIALVVCLCSCGTVNNSAGVLPPDVSSDLESPADIISPPADHYDSESKSPDMSDESSSSVTTTEPIDTTGVISLPTPESVDREATPLLWEFTHDCIGYTGNIAVPYMVAMYHKSAPAVFYVAKYESFPVQYAPKLGSSIFTLEATEQTASDLVANSDVLSTEGKWVLLDISSTGNTIPDLAFMYDEIWEDAGHTPYFLANGYGYPTDILRNNGYAEALDYEFGIDIYDVWWDSWTFQAKYPMVRDGTNEYIGYVSSNLPGNFVILAEGYTSPSGGELYLSAEELVFLLATEDMHLVGAPEIELQEDNGYEF